MIKKVLIANRGEIALSIFRNCRELGIETVSVYSDVDKDQPIVYLADEAICIGPAQSDKSYLNITNILTAAIKTNCDGIHPGYGFLSENAEFAKKVEACGLKLIGPSSSVIEFMGNKLSARKLMIKNNIPVVPGCNTKIRNKRELKKIASSIGYPILLKASSGGGGKGMRKVYRQENLEENWDIAKKEAKASFGNDEIYVEKLIENPRHIEIQILADGFGNIIHLNERECSIQRNNQKMIEEAPCKFVDENLINKMKEAAITCAKVCGYEGAGTVEFIVDGDSFYFIEMNTRIQVEHPVTEMITGVNIVKEQLRIASKLPISIGQDEVKKDGHAIEIRVNAQDPLNDFKPNCGFVNFYLPPGGMDTRFESSLYHGAKVLPFYDSMIGKLIVKGKTRIEAIKKCRRAIEETIIGGIKTNLSFQYGILHEKNFIRGNIDTNYINRYKEQILCNIRDIEDGERYE